MHTKFLSTLFLTLTLVVFSACSSTSTPDLKLVMILYCGGDGDSCNVEADDSCVGRGRWNDFRQDADIVINDTGGKLVKRHEMEAGTYDNILGTCTFSETIAMKASSRYEITVGDHGPFYITKSDLEKQNWAAVLEFNN